MNFKKFIKLCLFIISLNANARDIDSTVLFKGIAEQSHDYSCGAAALSTLITGVVENSSVSEESVVHAITAVKGNEKEEGYNSPQLVAAAKKLGYEARDKEIEPSNLALLKQPVVLLIGANNNFPHYVVFKGIENGIAFLADPLRGNIQIAYDELVKEGIGNKPENKDWLVISIKPSPNKPKDSTLYLSDDKDNFHFTVDESDVITARFGLKKDQVVMDYTFLTSLGTEKNNGLSRSLKNFNHIFAIKYGISDNAEIGGSVQYSDNTQITFENNKQKLDDSDRLYNVFISRNFKLDEASNLNVAFDSTYAERYGIYGVGLTVAGSKKTYFALLSLGGSIGKNFTYNSSLRTFLPESVSYSGFINANKKLSNDFNASVGFKLSQGSIQSENTTGTFERTYSTYASLNYHLNKDFNIAPSVAYYFGATEGFTFGMNVAYVGGW